MTLYKQLFFSTFFILVCLCSALWLGEFKRTRDFIDLQMGTQVQESATFLGLTLSSVQGGSEQVIMETMIDALFDSGAYRLIELCDMNGKVLVERRAEAASQQVPSWFTDQVQLAVPQASARVMHGWLQTGTVRIESQLDDAYQTLWQAAKSTALWFFMATLAFAALGGLVLRSILHPLNRIEDQAAALCNRQFDVQQKLPRARELRRVVVAMNTLTERLGQLFEEHAAIAHKLNQQVYQDQLTGIGNRRYLESQINARFASNIAPMFGVFFIVQLQDLKALNQQYGYEQGDCVLREVAVTLQNLCSRFPDSVLARLGGGDVALFLPGIDSLTGQHFVEEILHSVYRNVDSSVSTTASYSLSGGGVYFEQALPLSELLAGADMALTKTRGTDGPQVQVLTAAGGDSERLAGGRMQWRESVLDVIARENVVFYTQPTVNKANIADIIGHEIYARVNDPSGQHISLGMFAATAEQFGLMARLERIILERLMRAPLQQLLPHRIAINISPSSLSDQEFCSWLCQRLSQCAREGIFFNIEFEESRLHTFGEQIKSFADAMKKEGHGLGIDHFGQGLVNFGYLRWLMPDYVKIDRAIADDMLDKELDVRFLIDSLCAVAHSIGVKVVIKNIETESQWHVFSQLNIDAVQGMYIQQPVLLMNEQDKTV